MEDPEFWRWVWLATAVAFGMGELANPGSFFLAPFAIGAAVAAVLSFIGIPVALGWVVFTMVSGGAFLALRPLARRLDQAGGNPTGVGAQRLVGDRGLVLEDVPEGHDAVGLIRIGREEWRAQSADGSAITEGTPVTITEVRGTRVVVFPVGPSIPKLPTDRPERPNR